MLLKARTRRERRRQRWEDALNYDLRDELERFGKLGVKFYLPKLTFLALQVLLDSGKDAYSVKMDDKRT